MSGIKRGKDIKCGWEELIPKQPSTIKPDGYSTIREVAEKIGVGEKCASAILKQLREEGKINCVQMKNETGHIIWVYKD